MNSKSILFISPDYHCSFAYRDELRKLGWKADIYVGCNYPPKLLYSDNDILRCPSVSFGGQLGRLINSLLKTWISLIVFWKYKYFFYYGGIDQFLFFERKLRLNKIFGDSFLIYIWFAKLFNRKIIQLPSGCIEEETRANFSKLDDGNVCGNCGYEPGVCSDSVNSTRFDMIRRYSDMVIGSGTIDSSQYRATHYKYKAIDLELWKPELEIPEEFKLPPTENLRVMHAFFKQGREHDGKNIKGSPFILNAINRLKNEGYKIEYYYVTDVQSSVMRYYQAQADIIVENLIYGWWGSTGVEAMALGKPLVCYLRPSWKEFFLKTFPEYEELPVVEADTAQIYDVLKKLVTDHEYRAMTGKKSRVFAERHFDSQNNAAALSELLLKL